MNQTAAGSVVLLVDDEELFRMALRTTLGLRLPHVTVLEAEDGEAALSVLGKARVDCIVTDLSMPGMHGTTFLGELINRRIRASVVVVSAYVAEAPPVEGALRCVSKPVDLDLLWRSIGELLSCTPSSHSPARRSQVSVAGLVHVLACQARTCIVSVVTRLGGPPRRGELGMVRGQLVGAHSASFDSSAGRRLGLDAAIDMLTWEDAEVTIVDQAPDISQLAVRFSASLVNLLASAGARRKSLRTRLDQLE